MVRFAKVGAVPALVLLMLIVSFAAFDLFSGYAFNPPNLLLVLNIIFIAGTNLAVAVLSAKSYLNQGSPDILVIGCAVLVSGLAALAAGWASAVSANANVTIFNVGVLIASGLQVFAALLTFAGTTSKTGGSRALLVITYAAIAITILLLSALTLDGMLPPFFTSTGPTGLREFVLGTAGLLFVIAFTIHVRTFLKSKSTVLYWYSLALGSVAMGLLGSLFVTEFNGVLAWLTRLGQYIGGFYFLFAVLALRSTGFMAGWAEAFAADRRQIATFFSKMLDGFAYNRIVTDASGKPVDCVILEVNEACERIAGVKRADIVGKRLTQVFQGIENDSTDWIGIFGKVALTGEPTAFQGFSDVLNRWYSISIYSPKKGYLVGIFEDITERKKAEETLAFNSSLAENLSEAVISTDLNFNIKTWNRAAETIYGFKANEVIGKNNFEVLKTIVPDGSVEQLAQKLRETGSWQGETIQIKKDGGPVSVLSSVSIMQDKEGKALAIVAVHRDITRRKRNEDALSKQAALIDLTPDGIITKKLDGTITFWNHGAETMYGWTKDEALGQRVQELLNTKFPKPLKEIVNQIKSRGQWLGELIHVAKDGREIVVQSRWLGRFDNDNEVMEILESNSDITQRKQLQDKLEEYAKNLEALVEERTKKLELSLLYARSLIETSLDPLVTISARGKITDVNKATELATGCPREELIGSDFSDYFTEPEKARAGYKRVFTQGFVRDYPLAIRHKSGKITAVMYNAAVYRNEVGDIQGVFAAARDITEQRRAEELAKESAKRLKDAERLAAIGATAGMVGHDIRNPLQSIIGDLYLVKGDIAALPESDGKENVLESLSGIEKSVDYINKIVSDLQDYAKPITPVIRKTNLESTIQDLIAKNGVPANIKFSSRINKDSRQIKTDPDLLTRILGNLVSNSIQAMPDGGKLTIRAFREADNTVLTVQDTGVGISEEVKAKLFTPLFTTKSKGQGFGLSVVKRMTEALGGTVTFESEEGKGTRFFVRLPLRSKA